MITSLEEVTLDKVVSVYSGKIGCGCGCRGKHTYASAHASFASKERGYPLTPEEISDRTVKLIFNKVMKYEAKELDFEAGWIGFDTDTRRYTIYLKEEENHGA